MKKRIIGLLLICIMITGCSNSTVPNFNSNFNSNIENTKEEVIKDGEYYLKKANKSTSWNGAQAYTQMAIAYYLKEILKEIKERKNLGL